MSGLVNAVVLCAVAALVIARQFRAHRIGVDGRWWIMPAVLAFMALRGPGPIGPHHEVEASFLLCAELLTGLAVGSGWGWTTRIWAEPDGSVWSRSTKAAGAVWIAGICLRVVLFGIGDLLGVRQDSSALLLGLAVTLLARSALVARRARSLRPPAGGNGPTYGDGVSRARREERV